MVTIDELCQEGDKNKPARIVEVLIEQKIFSITDVLKNIDVKTLPECIDCVKMIIQTVANDIYINNKDVQKMINYKNLAQKMKSMYISSSFERNATTLGALYYYTNVVRKQLEERLTIFDSEKSKDKFTAAAGKIKEIYKFNDSEIAALRFFVVQASMRDYDPILNRSLYLWSEKKFTGKTTVAKIICGILNGYTNYNDIARNYGEFKSEISVELQFGRFDKPRAISCGAVLMDEAFVGKGTAKYYGKLKDVITSDNCRIEEKFGGVTNVDCRRNYVFTSNNPVDSVVDDAYDRRIYAIEMTEVPKQLDYDDITEVFKDFILNAYPDVLPMSDYYRKTMPNIEGRESIILKDMESYFAGSRFFEKVNIENNMNHYQLSFPGFFVKSFFEDCLYQRNSEYINYVKKAVVEMFGIYSTSTNRKYYNTRKIFDYLETIETIEKNNYIKQQQQQ